MSITPSQILKTLRLEHGFEQVDVALCTGIHCSKIGRFELGQQEPTLSELCALLVTFTATFGELFAPLMADTTAEVFARIADHKPPESASHLTHKRRASFQRLKANLNRLHDATA